MDMHDRVATLYQSLITTLDSLRERGEASDDDGIAACCELHGRLVAGASFLREETKEQYEHRIAVAKEHLEATIRVHMLALMRVMAAADDEDDDA